jgi:hypothetical protein
MADGARVLARIWEGAWAAAGGDALAVNLLGQVKREQLLQLYLDTDFVRSLYLNEIGPVLK